jgi:acetylornithine deacetylase
VDTPEILERLVSFPTVSRDSNLGLIEFVRDYLADLGIAARLYVDPEARKANLYASIGPEDRGGVLLSGHTDVVPVDGQNWSRDPFRLAEHDGRLFARGSSDMKGFIACALRAAALAARRRLVVPLQLAFSFDEEVGCLGVHSLIDDMATWPHRPQFCIVGEPTLLRSAIGHKGKTALKATCHGRAAHSAYPSQGINAIHMACDLVARVRARQARIAAEGPFDHGYTVPYTTLHVGVIHGGTVLNIVPSRCELELEIRNLPADDPAAIVAAMRADAAAAAGEGKIELEISNEYPGLDTPADAEVVRLAAALTGIEERIKVGYGTEGGLFSGELGIPTVVCGPGSIDQAHKPDEFIAVEQLDRCDRMLEALLERLT